MRCPKCTKNLLGTETSCPSCGAAVDLGESLEGDATRRLETSGSARQSQNSYSFDSIEDARFVPGTILAERYRIVGLLGKGGMGEVYRADDLKLGQLVALKFLSQHLSADEEAVARLYREVRITRQVSHPNVCRVYDI